MLSSSLLLKSKNLPNKTGVYLFYKKKTVLYIGKSNNIKRRVASYFNSSSVKNNLLVSSATSIDYVLVSSEEDALFLENSLIKKHKPKYNVLLKDDKSFPWICIKNERFPRVFVSRKRTSDSDFYFGPYINKRFLNNLIDVVFDFYPVRSCAYNLSEKNIYSKKHKVCLDYHLKKCLGPCEGFQDEKSYNNSIFSIKLLLEGRYSSFLKKIKKELVYCTEKLLFERCDRLKKLINSVNYLKSKSVVVSNKKIDVDSFFIFSFNNYYYINFIRIIEGSIVYFNNYKFKNNGVFSESDVLIGFLKKTFVKYKFVSKNLICNINIGCFLNKKIIVPKRGYKKKILDFSYNNLLSFLEKSSSKNNIGVLKGLKELLFLKDIPFNIHCFDVSNLSGTNTTASCVVFKNGKPFKSDYRSFIIKKTTGIDDYLSLSEAVEKKYKKLKTIDYPNLIIIDGGKGQLKAVLNTLKKLNLKNLSVISIAKKEEIIYLNNFNKIILNKKNDCLKLIQFLRNEAHRFCLKHHRLIRNNNFIKSELNNINGLGPKTIFILLKKFKNLKNIKNTSEKDLINFLGYKKGSIVYNYFNK